jgi:glutathione S-transferase
MSQTVTLGYWNIRGFAERVRLLLEYLNIQYDQVIFTP